MTEYKIADNEVQISTEVENERYVKKSTTPLLADIGSIFDTWYASQSDCYAINRNAETLIDKAIGPLVSKAVKILSDQGVYSIDEDLFVRKYLSGFDEEFYDTLDKMMDRIAEIEGQLASEKRYRELRKASRGRVVGGGFGLGGALKGMATAGVMNATTGMAHSLGNAVGNMGSSMSASSNKTAVYKNAKQPLRDAIIGCGYYVRNGIRNALEQEANIKCKYVTITESNQAEAILKNYVQDRIPEEQRKNQIVQALLLDPYSVETYEVIWNDYGDPNGDLRKMSSYFDCDLEQKIQAIASKYGEDIFNSSCGEYLNAFNKTKAAVKLEVNITDSLKKMEQYCEKHNIDEDLIPKISFCKKLLQIADVENKTVKGVIYSTREIADKVKTDYFRFYKNCEGKNLANDVQFNQLCEQSYVSEEFNEIARSLCKKERIRRDPEKIYDNIWDTFNSSLDESTLSAIGVNVIGKFGKFEQHESTARTITGMTDDEIPLFVIDCSNNGKSGIMITDKFLRIYSKGLLSTENQVFDITKISSLECIGRDKFVIDVDKENLVNVSFKIQNVSDEKQILFANAFNEAVQIITNLYLPHRQNLYRILYGIATCTCGMKLISNEKICPSCGKMLTNNGEFVETKYCTNCGAMIQKGKKFCSYCGFSLIEENHNNNLDMQIPHEKVNEAHANNGSYRFDNGGQKPSKQNIFTIKEKTGTEISFKPQYCPKCGATLEDNVVFCDECGVQLIQQNNSNVSSTQPVMPANVPESSNINLQSLATPKQSDGLKNSGLGIASMVFGIISAYTWGVFFLPELIGLILGIIAIRKKDTKHSFAIVGIVTSAIAFVIIIGILLS